MNHSGRDERLIPHKDNQSNPSTLSSSKDDVVLEDPDPFAVEEDGWEEDSVCWASALSSSHVRLAT